MKNFWKRLRGQRTSSDENIVETAMCNYSFAETALAKYLHYYSTLNAPGYAVLVTGPWGVGKTFQVKQVIPESGRYYVSLYGLESVNSIHDAVLAATLPSMRLGSPLSLIGEVGKSMGDGFALAGLSSSLWSAYLRQRLKPDRTIVFDDLERSTLWRDQKGELLGAINQYAEHLGFRVIVICHEDRIAEELAQLKEKTFGHTVKASPNTKAAVESFLAEIQDETTKTFITSNMPLIEEIWYQSGQSSLRILKHVISDIARLSGVLAPRHLEKKEAIDHLLRFFCALDIEVRSGNMDHESLTSRMERHVREAMGHDAQGESQQFSKVNSRYPSSDLTGRILSDEVVVATLVEGLFDAELIGLCLDQSAYFIQASNEAPWRIVMHFDKVEDALLDESVVRMQAQFDERSITNMGEFLHVAALRLMMAEQQASSRTLEQEYSLCTGYIDDLLEMKKMPVYSLSPTPFHRSRDSYDGYAFWVSDATRHHFSALCDHLDNAQQIALEATYPEHATNILDRLRDDQSSLLSLISTTNSGQGLLANIPVMKEILPKEFVDAWLGGSRSSWRSITIALDCRYGYKQLERNLRDEIPWLLELKTELDRRINSEHGLAALRLRRIRPEVFDTIQEDLSRF